RDIMGTEEIQRDMSPADTMTIAITLQTLTILDQLLTMLKKRSGILSTLALRVQWEREFEQAMKLRQALIDEIHEFILSRGRWKPPTGVSEDEWLVPAIQPPQKDINSEANKIDHKIAEFEQTTIPPTSDIFDEFCNVADEILDRS